MAASAGGGGLGTLGWVAVAGAVSAAAAGGAYFSGVFDQPVSDPVELVAMPQDTSDATAPSVTEPEPVTPEPEVVSKPDPDPEPQPEPVAEATPETDVVPEPEPALPALAAPSFDVVRVEVDGTTVIAGTGTAGSTITVLLDNDELDRFDVDASGSFVSFLLLPPSDAPRILSMTAQLADQTVLSEDQIILAPTPRSEPVVAATPEPEQVATATPDPVAEPDADTAVVEEPPIVDPKPEQVAAAEPASTDSIATPQVDAAVEPDADPDAATNAIAPDAKDPAAELAEAQPEPTQSVTSDEPAIAADTPAAATTQVPDESDQVAMADTQITEATTETETSSGTEIAVATETVAVDKPTIAPKPRPEVPVATADVAAPDQPTVPNTPPQPEPETAEQDAPEAAPTTEATSVAVLRADADGVELIQSGTAPRPDVLDEIILETISYSEDGEVQLTGRAGDSAIVRVYLDNKPVTDLGAGQDGKWKGQLEGIKPGIYTLRLDELNAAGEVVSRLETPFKRESPEVLVPAASQEPGAAPPIRAVTVQKGDTLWAISRDRYGDGVLYVKVFDANRGNIRNPNLIYPGQVFSIPD